MDRQESGVLERFLRYARVHTTSAADKDVTPSTQCQFDLARMLVEELRGIGIHDVVLDDHCILVANIPTNLDHAMASNAPVPTVCFLAHMDTSPEEPGEHVRPRVFTYDGGAITFPENQALSISPEDMPALSQLVGDRIVTSDGTTLLGADDKAGIAEIVTAAAWLMDHPEFPRSRIKIVFTPDEEVGQSVDKLDVKALDADFGYTLDGDELGVIEAECFNAMSGSISIKGFNVHPGYAYDKMINATRVMRDVIGIFPDGIAPETTKDRQGYYHVTRAGGDVNEANVHFILRDFDQGALIDMMARVKAGLADVQRRWPKAIMSVSFKDGYRNMKEIMDEHPRAVAVAEKAIRLLGIEPLRKPIRGGTDGARLSFMGLPCPNLFAGGMNFHSKKEFVPVSWMERAVQMIVNIVGIVAKNGEIS